jgi:hypothetical protein
MKCNQHRFAIVVVAFITLSLLVLSVSATTSVEGPVMGKGTPTITGGFANFATRHAMRIEGDWYLTHPLNKKTLFDYIECEKPYLKKNPGSKMVIDVERHGWITNSEVIAESDGKNVTVMLDVVNQILPEIEANQLKFLGVTNSKGVWGGEWEDVVWGTLRATPSPYLFKFAEKHPVKKNADHHYYLIHTFDKNTLFDYIDNEIMHLAQHSSNAVPPTKTPGLAPKYKKTAIGVLIHDPDVLDQPEVVVAKTLATKDDLAFTSLADKSVYALGMLRNHPEKYTGWHIIWMGQYSVVCVDMTAVNKLLSQMNRTDLDMMHIRKTETMTDFFNDVVWGPNYKPS